MKSDSVSARQIASGVARMNVAKTWRGAASAVVVVVSGDVIGSISRMVLRSAEEVGGADRVAVQPPVVDAADGNGIEVVVALPSDLAARDQVGPLEDAEVLHDAEPRHRRQRRLQLSQRLAITLEEPVEQRPATGIGQRAEHLVVHAGNNT